MGLKNNSQRNVTFLRKQEDKEGNARFIVMTKEGATDEAYTTVDNVELVAIYPMQYNYKERGTERTGYSCNILLKDLSEDAEYLLNIPYSYYLRILLNKLASVSDFKGKSIQFSNYKNKNGYAACYIEIDGIALTPVYDFRGSSCDRDSQINALISLIQRNIKLDLKEQAKQCFVKSERAFDYISDSCNDFKLYEDNEIDVEQTQNNQPAQQQPATQTTQPQPLNDLFSESDDEDDDLLF
jgi:hypothetical protein